MASNTSAVSYKYQFVSEPDNDLKCLICLKVAEEPWQHGKCGRLFCEKCLNEHGKKSLVLTADKNSHNTLRMAEVSLLCSDQTNLYIHSYFRQKSNQSYPCEV